MTKFVGSILPVLKEDTISKLYTEHFGSHPDKIRALPAAGSSRRYYRLSKGSTSCIAASCNDKKEMDTFLYFSKHFREKGLHVPEIYTQDATEGLYLLEDLGDTSLKDLVDRERKKQSKSKSEGGNFPEAAIPYYKKALEHLLNFQFEAETNSQAGASAALDYSRCIPRDSFDGQSILWDLNHFKYYFIKLLDYHFDEQKLEDDFQQLAEHLAAADSSCFMYRDFQSRNIMIRDEKLYFIDYQGGRRGALQYDVASLLFEARTDLPNSLREELLAHYLKLLQEKHNYDPAIFMKQYYSFVLIRILQAMGAYGLRGVVEGKALFLQSIPFAVRNLRWLLSEGHIPEQLTELKSCLQHIIKDKRWQQDFSGSGGEGESLLVNIQSFSFKKGIPADLSGNGGGFVFDCRALPNPGRYQRYRILTGKDPEVISFLAEKPAVSEFLENAAALVSQSIREYTSRGFSNLMVNFGCTGGQHRSVYCAEQLYSLLKEKFQVEIRISHREQE